MRLIAASYHAASANGVAQQRHQVWVDAGAWAGAYRLAFGAHQRFEFGFEVRPCARPDEGAQLGLQLLKAGGPIHLPDTSQMFRGAGQFRQLLCADADERRQTLRLQPPVLVQILGDDLLQAKEHIHRVAQALSGAAADTQALPDLADGHAATRRLHADGEFDDVDGAFVHGVQSSNRPGGRGSPQPSGLANPMLRGASSFASHSSRSIRSRASASSSECRISARRRTTGKSPGVRLRNAATSAGAGSPK